MKRVEYLFMVSVVLTLFLWTHQRNVVWQDEVTLWQDAISKSPGKERPYSNLSAAYIARGNWERGIEYSLKALKIDDKPYYIYYNLSIAYAGLRNGDQAYANARKAAVLHTDTLTLTNLGLILKAMGYKTDGKRVFRVEQ